MDFLPGFYGGAVADEPTAASIGRDVLAEGGSAADAAVAMYFALAVTKPASAGLGAVGTCLAYEPAAKRVRALDFTSAGGSSGSVAIPGAVRGMYALHAAMGRRPWSQLLAPAEMLARFGAPATRSFLRDLEANPAVAGDEAFGPHVRTGTGALIGEGERFVQPELADFINGIRVEGAPAFYSGHLGERFAEAVALLGQRFDFAEMRAEAPKLSEPLTRPAGNAQAHFMPTESSAGPYQAELWSALSDGQRAGSASVRFADGTTLVVADQTGSAVACGFTLNRPFGIGRTAPGTGIFPAALPERGTISGALSPVIVANHYTDILLFAGAASGAGGPDGVVGVGVRTQMEGEPLGEAIREQAAGLVNAVSCPDGLPHRPDTCTIAADPRGSGYAAAATPRSRQP